MCFHSLRSFYVHLLFIFANHMWPTERGHSRVPRENDLQNSFRKNIRYYLKMKNPLQDTIIILQHEEESRGQ